MLLLSILWFPWERAGPVSRRRSVRVSRVLASPASSAISLGSPPRIDIAQTLLGTDRPRQFNHLACSRGLSDASVEVITFGAYFGRAHKRIRKKGGQECIAES